MTKKDREERKKEPGSWFKQVGRGLFYLSLLYTLGRVSCNAKDHADYVSSLSNQGQQQEMMEKSVEGQSLLEEKLRAPGEVELDSSQSLADFLKEGATAQDLGHFQGGESRLRPQEMDATGLMLTAKEFRFKLDQPKADPGTNDMQEQGPQKYLNLEADVERGHQFELRKSDGDKTLTFNRDTSHIVPRGQLDYGSKAKEKKPEKELEVIRDNKAVILVDTSGSMCSNPHNYQQKSFNGQRYTVYLPSAFALSIADFYVHERNADVSAFVFSTHSFATPFTRNMATLANQFAKVECNGTYIDYALLERILKGSSSALDIYIIADNDVFSEQAMRQNIAELQRVMGTASLNRVFFIEWRNGEHGYNPRKDEIIKETGIPQTWYSRITRLEDMQAVSRTLNEKMKRGAL